MKYYLLLFFSIALESANCQSILYNENFDNIAIMFSSGGWSQNNLSNPVGNATGIYVQGFTVGSISPAYNGIADSYITTNYQCGAGVATLSNWLISPVLNFQNGDEVSFYTLAFNNIQYADRLECRLSTNGSNVNVGTNEFSIGDFTSNLVTVNPNLDNVSYPSFYLGNQTWTKFTGIVSGLSGTTAGRIGFRYFVTNGGPSGTRSSTIGIDEFVVNRPSLSINGNVLKTKVSISPNPSADFININSNHDINATITIIDIIGKEVLTAVMNSRNLMLDISKFSKGCYSVKFTDISTGLINIDRIIKY